MNIDDLKKLAPADAIKAAAEYAGVPPSILDGIWRVESGRGTNKGPSKAGAVGDFQIMPKTQALIEKKLGQKFDATNFHDSLRMAAEHIRDDFQREGNIPDTLRAYQAGPDRKKWGGPENTAYAAKVMMTDVPEYKPAVSDIDRTAMPAKLERKEDYTGMPRTAQAMLATSFLTATLGDTPTSNAFEQAVDQGSKEAIDAQTTRNDMTLVETAKAMFMHQGLAGAIGRVVARDTYTTTPGYKVPEELLEGLTVDQAAHVLDATSEAQARRFRAEMDVENDDMRRANANGAGWAFAGSILAGFPEGVFTGVGVAKSLAIAGMGSAAAAAAGNAGRAVALSAVEQVGGNLLTTAAEDAITGRVSVFDYAASATIGALAMGLEIPGVTHAAGKANAIQAEARFIERQLQMAKQAETTLGPGATKEQISAEISRMEAAMVRSEINLHSGDLPTERKLFSEDVNRELSGEAPMVPTSRNQQGTPGSDKADTSNFNEPDKGDTVLKGPTDLNAYSADPKTTANMTSVLEHAPTRQIAWGTAEDVATGQAHPDSTIDDRLRGLGIDPTVIRSGQRGVFNGAGTTGLSGRLLEAAQWLHKTFASDTTLILASAPQARAWNGMASYLGNNTVLLEVVPGRKRDVLTLVHEVGHAVIYTQFAKLSPELRGGFSDFYREFLKKYYSKDYKGAALSRGAVASEYTENTVWAGVTKRFSQSMFDIMAGVVDQVGQVRPLTKSGLDYAKDYIPKVDEVLAENFVKYLEAAIHKELGWKPGDLPEGMVNFFQQIWQMVKSIYKYAVDNKLIAPDTRVSAMFDGIRDNNAKAVPTPVSDEPGVTGNAVPTSGAIPLDAKYGINLMPEGTPMERAQKRAMLELYARADNPQAPWNNIDPKFVSSLTDNNVVQLGSTGLLLLKSDNPVARMLAHELLESTTGATGRHSTAAIARHIVERRIMGNTINEVQDTFVGWANAQGMNAWNKYADHKAWERFNMLVAEHTEAVRMGRNDMLSNNEFVVAAAARMENLWTRSRLEQVNGKTLGYAGLPASSRGYMPHSMSPSKLRNMSQAQEQAFHAALVDQFVGVEGFDISFSANLASRYMDAIRARANGGFNAPLGAQDAGAADLVRRALEDMDMAESDIEDYIAKYTKGGASHTKKRLNLDLLAEHPDGNGGTFRLLDFYETDQIALARRQVGRVSGEVALARHGIMGRPGLKVLRKALDFGANGGKIQPKELEAFDQIAAEFLGDPFGQQNKTMDRVGQLNSLVRLGGMMFNQIGEGINIILHMGLRAAFENVIDAPRLRAEIKALARGERVDNGILSGIETLGVKFGTDSYKMVMPFDKPDMPYQTNTADTVHLMDRLLRGGSHAQAKLSFWRTIHSVQQRGMAEQILHRTFRYLRDEGGRHDQTLLDMGVTPELAASLRAQAGAVTWEGDSIKKLDITLLSPKTAEQLVEVVLRGTNQIIQGTFIGETGKWAHDGWLRLLSQFRTFSITSIEKQWGRHRANRGTATALAMVMGAMSMALPLHYARVLVNSQGRSDREEYIDKHTSLDAMARATLNYIPMAGLSGDFVDAMTAVTGISTPSGGGRSGGTEFVGNVVLPAAGMVDDAWKAIQNTRDGTDPTQLMKVLPFSNLPALKVAINYLGN